jgi:hypothetical protein
MPILSEEIYAGISQGQGGKVWQRETEKECKMTDDITETVI